MPVLGNWFIPEYWPDSSVSDTIRTTGPPENLSDEPVAPRERHARIGGRFYLEGGPVVVSANVPLKRLPVPGPRISLST
jgi:hypothetical protein